MLTDAHDILGFLYNDFTILLSRGKVSQFKGAGEGGPRSIFTFFVFSYRGE